MTELPDRLLRDALRPAAPAATSNVCIDAEALAAWADGAMSRADRAAFEIHAADCARCQALMGAMARTEPPPIEPAWWRRARVAWLMPLAAATAAILIVGSLAITERRVPAPQVARIESRGATPSRAEELAPRSAAPAAPASAARQPPAPVTPDSRRDRVAATRPTVRPQGEPKGAGVPAAKTEPRPQDAAATAAPRSAPPSPTAAAPATAPAAGVTETVVVTGASPLVDTRDEVQTRMKAAASALVLIASPARESQWRIVNGAVEHTADGGATWQAQALGVHVPVRAGAAPAAHVCWLAGARGLVLLTTDGVNWLRIGFPESVDLVAIQATDATHATVTTVAARSFSTSDGGKTWTSR